MKSIHHSSLLSIAGGKQMLQVKTNDTFIGVPDACIVDLYTQQLKEITLAPDQYTEQMLTLCPALNPSIKMQTRVLGFVLVNA